MSEELNDASLQLPRAMMWAAVGNGLLGVRTYLYNSKLARTLADMNFWD